MIPLAECLGRSIHSVDLQNRLRRIERTERMVVVGGVTRVVATALEIREEALILAAEEPVDLCRGSEIDFRIDGTNRLLLPDFKPSSFNQNSNWLEQTPQFYFVASV